MKKLFLTPALAIVLTSLISLPGWAKPDVPAASGGRTSPSQFSKVKALCIQGTSKAELDINNVRAMVLNGGDYWWDLSDARYEVPKIPTNSSEKRTYAIFAGAVWIGGMEQGTSNLNLAAQTFRQGGDAGYWPGPLDNTGQTSSEVCTAFDFHSKIDKQVITDFVNSYVPGNPVPEANIPQAIKNWPAKGNPFRANISSLGAGGLAPYVDVDSSGSYDPRGGDYPKIRGDQSIWWVVNDAGGVKEPVSPAINMEVQTLGFAFQTSDLINNMTFYEQTLINRGSKTLEQTYLAQWVDPDLGNYLDDYVGCDVARGMGIVFNGDDLDEGISGYGANPPALGVDFFQGPRSEPNDGLDNNRNGIIDELVSYQNPETGEIEMVTEEIVMSNFMYFNNDNSAKGNPTVASDYYNYMRSIWRNNRVVTYGGDGFDAATPNVNQYKFMFPGTTDPLGYGFHQPVTHTPDQPVPYVPNQLPFQNWSERNPGPGLPSNEPADRRFLLSAGPFTLRPGQVIPLTIGVVWVRANSGGATGSLGLLRVADDNAQALFDNNFELPLGPPAPVLSITELDKELIIAIKQTEEVRSGKRVTTEGFVEIDKQLSSLQYQDPYYRFQGYVLYQLRDAKVTADQLDDPTFARIVEQSDVKDDLSLLVNRVFDPELNEYKSVVQVRGENEGVTHTVRVTKDLFARGDDQLVNYKKYYYRVVAYASNPLSDATFLNSFKQYRPSQIRNEPYSAIPHKPIAENNGTTLQSNSGDFLPVTKIYGVGNGQNVLNISEQEEANLVDSVVKPTITYLPGGAPVAIKIYDPKLVTKADFNLKLSSRLSFYADEVEGEDSIEVGDIIVSGPIYTPTSPSLLITEPQIPGIARVNRIVSNGPRPDDQTGRSIITLDIEMLNDEKGGTFETVYEEHVIQIDPATGTSNDVFLGYVHRPNNFTKQDDPNVGGKVFQYKQSDFWRLNITNGSGNDTTIYSARTVTEFNEQLLPEYGLSIQLQQAFNPGHEVETFRENHFQEASLTFKNGSRWLEGVDPADVPWLPAAANSIDPGQAYNRVLDGSWAPYGLADFIDAGNAGATYKYVNDRRIYKLPNVNVVITPDKSKWTRVVVLQTEVYSSCADTAGTGIPRQLQRLLKSSVPSVDKDGNPTGETSSFPGVAGLPSTGMGWFPGYAVDLDKGIRLNMMFSESRKYPGGNNLQWDPTTDANGGRSFIYIARTPYDQGTAYERVFDSLLTRPQYYNTSGPNQGCLVNSQVQNFGNQIKLIFDDISWVGNMKLAEGHNKLEDVARISLRVDKKYTSYSHSQYPADNDNPEYKFSTNGYEVKTNNSDVASSALDLIRVVPNPYYAYSDYENQPIDNRVKITNLPPRCDISIFNLNGTLVQNIHKDDVTTTFVDWNLKNKNNLAIGSGVYIIHVKTDVGEKVVKFFAILRPADLTSF